MNKTIEIETVRAGQPRPYADSVYEYVYTFSWQPEANWVRYIVKATHKPNGKVVN